MSSPRAVALALVALHGLVGCVGDLQLAENFTVDFTRDGKQERVLESGPYGLGSDIHVYDPQILLQSVTSLSNDELEQAKACLAIVQTPAL